MYYPDAQSIDISWAVSIFGERESRLMPSHVLVRMATTGIYLLHGIPRELQHAARVRAVRDNTTLRAVLLRALNDYAAGAWPLQEKEDSRQNDFFRE